MHRDHIKVTDEKSDDSSHHHAQLKRRSHQFNLTTNESGMLPIKNVDVIELVKTAAAKIKKIKLPPNESYYLIASCKSDDIPLIIVPKVESAAITDSSLNEVKAIQQFINAHSIYYIDYENVLGAGGQGKVVMAHNIITAELAAVKICNTHGNEHAKKQIEAERRNLKKLNRLYGYCSLYSEDVNNQDFPEATVMRYYPSKTLNHFLYLIDEEKDKKEAGYYKEKLSINIFKKVGIALHMIKEVAMLHKNGLIHRDIKPDNFMVNEDSTGNATVTLIDVGDAIPLEEINRVYASTFGYGAPEVWSLPPKRSHYTIQSDYFSLGVAIGELLSGENYQAKLAKLKLKQIEKDTLSELMQDDIYKLLSDIIVSGGVSKTNAIHVPEHFNYVQLTDYLDEVVYNKWMKHSMHALLLSLTKNNPLDRLAGSDLVSELVRLQELYRHCLMTSKAMKKVAQEVIYVCNALEVSKVKISKSVVYEQFLTQLNEILREQKAIVSFQDLPPVLMSAAADRCITFFSHQSSATTVPHEKLNRLTKQ